MKNKRKIIKNCIIIILIILLILVFKDIFRAVSYLCFSDYFKVVLRDNYKELDRSNPMTAEEVAALLEKGSNYNNYVVTRKFKQRKDGAIYQKEYENKIFVKDNIVSSITDGKNDYWLDYNQNLYIMNSGFVATLLLPIDKFLYYDEGVYRQKATDYTGFFTGSSIISYPPPESKFEYWGEMDLNGRRTIVTRTVDVEFGHYEKYYIDKETGVIVNKERFQHEYIWLFNDMLKLSFLYKTINYCPAPYNTSGYNFSVEFDCVTDEDVKKPNYAGRIVYNYFYEEDEERKYNRII